MTSHDKRLLGIPTTLKFGERTRKLGEIVACSDKKGKNGTFVIDR